MTDEAGAPVRSQNPGPFSTQQATIAEVLAMLAAHEQLSAALAAVLADPGMSPHARTLRHWCVIRAATACWRHRLPDDAALTTLLARPLSDFDAIQDQYVAAITRAEALSELAATLDGPAWEQENAALRRAARQVMSEGGT